MTTPVSRQKFVMGNWKMHGNHEVNHALLEQIKSVQVPPSLQVVVFPPFVYIEKTSWELRNSKIQWGGQNVCAHEEGAYTGEVSAKMLKDLGCGYALIGHSERRQYFKETLEEILDKAICAAKAGLKPVLCVGETLAERHEKKTEQKILAQLESVIKSPQFFPYLSSLVIAYEPVWAIGTGLTATPDEAQKVHAFIREVVEEVDANLAKQISILYGGSIKSTNAKSLLSMPDIDGGLVGGASLIGEEFLKICHFCLSEG